MNAAFEAMELDWVFIAFEVGAGGGEAALRAAEQLGFEGCSVTMPLKQEVAEALERLDPLADALDAVNCIYRDDDGFAGANTDGAGFCAALAEAGVGIESSTVGVIGAGGAARSIIAALDLAGVDGVVIVNRSAANAGRAAALSSVARVGTPEDLSGVDVVVNATSVGMGDGALPVDPDLLTEGQVVAELVYQPLETPLLREARSRNLTVLDGIGMLVHQAALSVELWTGRRAPIAVMADAARRALRTG